jgi:RNA polymerase sigma-70 factor (ECF subfamily)
MDMLLRMRGELQRFLRARRVSVEDGEDLLQELYLKISALDSGPIGEPRAYLYRMVNNLLIDRRRAEQRRSTRDLAWTEAQAGPMMGIDDSPSAERVLSARSELRRIDEVLSELPERTADVFRSFRIEGVPQRMIATRMGISLSAVEKHLQRAYRAILDSDDTESADPEPPRRLTSRGPR